MNRIHKFELNNRKIVLDIESGSVHVVDNITWDVIDLILENEKEDIQKALSDKYDIDEIGEAYNEVKALIEEQMLFTENSYPEDYQYNSNGVVKALCLHIAHDCNLKCNYCFASQGDFNGEKAFMSLEVGKKALEFLVKHSKNRRNLEVDFFGGEPLMNFEVVKELVHYGRLLEKEYNKNFRFTLTTNGLLLDDEKMAFINEHMSNVVLSLDGRKEVNDHMRQTLNGEGSYDIIVPKFKKMIETRGNKDYYVRGTFTSKNLDFSKDALKFHELGFKSTSIEPVVTEPNQDYALKKEHLDVILNEYEKLSKTYLDLRKEGDPFSFFHFNIDLEQGPCAIKRASGCGAGSEYLAVTPEGDFYPCHQFVGEESFKLGDVFSGLKKTEHIETFKSANVFTKDACKTCWARFYCSGGCHANAYYENDDITKPYELGCEMEKKRIECAISIAANMA